MHQAFDAGYPGLEKDTQEQREPNSGLLRLPDRTPTNSPLVGRQEKPVAACRTGGGVLQPRALGLFGSATTPTKAAGAAARAPSAWTDASPEPIYSALQPADSCDPTVDGPAPKRPRLAGQGSVGYGLLQAGWPAPALSSFGSAASCESDNEGEEAVVSRKRPTPQKAAAVAAAAATMLPAPVQHPSPTWTASLRHHGETAAANPAAAAVTAHHHMEQDASMDAAHMDAEGGCTPVAAAGADEGEAWSDMEEDEEADSLGGPWQCFPYPHQLDVEE